MPTAKRLARKRVAKKLAGKAKPQARKKPAKKKPASKAARELTPKQVRFANYYISGESATQAARLAGYSCKTDGAFRVQGTRLVADVNIKAYIDEQMREETAEATLSRQRKREILKGIAEAWKSKGELEGDRQAAIQAIKVDNSMTGDDAPVRVEGELTLKGILQAVTGSTGLPQDEDD